jgi:FkbM family methyltransferase
MERMECQPAVMTAHVPVVLEAPASIRGAVAEVLGGEYEAGFFGQGLTILDIGANVGSFSLWANLRWPRSTIYAYEPHPGTFAILRRNLSNLSNMKSYNVAVYPIDRDQAMFFARYDGDGEAGLVDCMARTFAEIPDEQTFPVTVLHPRALPPADVVKLDVEGAESEILRYMDLSEIALILLEYQDDANRLAIKDLLVKDFVLEYEDSFAWDDLLAGSAYRPDLGGNHYGRMFFSNRHPGRLHKMGPPRAITAPAALSAPLSVAEVGVSHWRHALATLIRHAKQSIKRAK